MASARHKELKLAYKLAMPPMGVFGIRNTATGRLWFDQSRNLVGSLNRHRMELQRGVHRHAALMADWRAHGEAVFVFEVLDRLEENTRPDRNFDAELAELMAAWRAKVPDGSPLSNR